MVDGEVVDLEITRGAMTAGVATNGDLVDDDVAAAVAEHLARTPRSAA